MLCAQALHSMLINTPSGNRWDRLSFPLQRIYIKLTFRPLEENSYEGAEVSGGVCEGEVVSRETSTRDVLNRAHVLHVGWILARARDPHRVQSVRVLLRFDVLLKIGGHAGGQILRVVVIFRLPAENLTRLYIGVGKSFQTRIKYTYLVQFEEDAGGGFVVTVLVLLRALPPRRHVHVAYFAGGRWFTVVANRPFLGTVRRRGWLLIFCNVFKTFVSRSNIIYRENMVGDWEIIIHLFFQLFQESLWRKM